MTFFVDTNVIIYAVTPSRYTEPCAEILEAIARLQVEGRTSTAVLEEVWHLELRGRAGADTGTTARAHALFAPLLPVTDDVFRRALALSADGIGANDRIHVATALANGCDVIVSADTSFDGIRGITRVDPLDDRARRRLLRT